MSEFKLDFLGIGVPRGGSTWIHSCLAAHPDICMSSTKELNFFTNKNENNRFGVSWLESFFSHRQAGEITGDYSPSTLAYASNAIELIKQHNADMKFIVCFRNPIERAWSHYVKHKIVGEGGFKQKENLQEAVQNNEMAYYRYIEKGMYSKNLKKFLAAFPRDQFLFLVLDDAKEDSVRFIQSIFKFLGVDDNFDAGTFGIDINRTGYRVAIFPQLNYYLNRFADSLDPGQRNKPLRRIISLIKRINTRKTKRKLSIKPSSETREFLQNAFKEDIEEMERILGRSLDFWK